MGETTTRSELFEALTIARSDCTLLAPTALASGANIELTNEDPHRAFRVRSPALHSQDTRDLCTISRPDSQDTRDLCTISRPDSQDTRDLCPPLPQGER